MESRATAAGHAVHQQLIVFPLGLLATAVVSDLIGLVTGDGRFASASYLMIGAGVLMGVVAAVFGLIDYLAIPRGTRARRIGILHGGGNVVMLVLFRGLIDRIMSRSRLPTKASVAQQFDPAHPTTSPRRSRGWWPLARRATCRVRRSLSTAGSSATV